MGPLTEYTFASQFVPSPLGHGTQVHSNRCCLAGFIICHVNRKPAMFRHWPIACRFVNHTQWSMDWYAYAHFPDWKYQFADQKRGHPMLSYTLCTWWTSHRYQRFRLIENEPLSGSSWTPQAVRSMFCSFAIFKNGIRQWSAAFCKTGRKMSTVTRRFFTRAPPAFDSGPEYATQT